MVQHDTQLVLHWHDPRQNWSPHRHAPQSRWCLPDWYSHALPGRRPQPPQVQLPWQTCCEHGSQPPPWVAPGAHGPLPAQPPAGSQAQAAEQRCVCVPQLPQGCVRVAPAAQAPSPVHVDQAQAPVQVCVPQRPQA